MSFSVDDDSSTVHRDGGEPDALSTLLRTARRRVRVPPERTARVHATVRREWDALVERRRLRRRWAWRSGILATAAGLAWTLWIGGRPSGVEPAPMVRLAAPPLPVTRRPIVTGRIERVVEGAWSRPTPDGIVSASHRGDEVHEGSEVVTEAGGRLALRLETGHSVRLDASSAIRVAGPRHIALLRGAVYVDSGGPAHRAGSITIQTSLGSIRDVGTQFEVRDTGTSLRIRVREGKVAVESAGVAMEVPAGQEAALARDGGVIRRDVAVGDVALDWVASVSPPLDLQGRSLQEFLSWVARELGLELRFAAAELAATAPGIVLSGGIEGMSLEEALESVLLTCRMSYRIEGRALVIGRAGASRRSS